MSIVGVPTSNFSLEVDTVSTSNQLCPVLFRLVRLHLVDKLPADDTLEPICEYFRLGK